MLKYKEVEGSGEEMAEENIGFSSTLDKIISNTRLAEAELYI